MAKDVLQSNIKIARLKMLEELALQGQELKMEYEQVTNYIALYDSCVLSNTITRLTYASCTDTLFLN